MSNQLLQLANQLIAPAGAISGHRGPLDAQFAFFNLLLGFNFTISGIDTNVTMSYLESVGELYYNASLNDSWKTLHWNLCVDSFQFLVLLLEKI